MRRAGLLLLLVTWGCPQTVVVYDSGAPPDATTASPDATADAGRPDAPDNDTDAAIADTGAEDAAMADAGEGPCGGAQAFCLTIEPPTARVNVGETTRFIGTLSNPEGANLRVELCEAQPRAVRLPGRPALRYEEIEWSATLDAAGDGTFDFVVQTVPPWFIATTFEVDVCVFEGPSTTPSQVVPVTAHVRGNVLVAAGYQGIFAVDSGGRPATGKNAQYPEGKIIDDTITRVSALRMAQDGTLLALDPDVRPPRIHRYGLDRPENRLNTFAHMDVDLGGAAPLSYDNVAVFSIAQRPDGVVAVVDSHNSGTPNPRILLWNPDGSFNKAIIGPNPQFDWYSVAARDDQEFLVGETENIRGQVLRISPADGQVLGPFTEDLRKNVMSMEPLADGRVAIAGERLLMIVGDGGAAISITDIPNSGSRDFRALTRFDGRFLVASDLQSETDNVAIIEDGRFAGWLRRPGGPIIVPLGLAYLE